jgi:hypothetical protein
VLVIDSRLLPVVATLVVGGADIPGGRCEPHARAARVQLGTLSQVLAAFSQAAASVLAAVPTGSAAAELSAARAFTQLLQAGLVRLATLSLGVPKTTDGAGWPTWTSGSCGTVGGAGAVAAVGTGEADQVAGCHACAAGGGFDERATAAPTSSVPICEPGTAASVLTRIALT